MPIILFCPALLSAGESLVRVGLAVDVPASSARVDKKKGTYNGRRYRGELKVVPAGKGRVTVVNVVGLEDYVRGVVASEVSHTWPMETLKCQAVVARSYAVANKGRFASKGYDLCDTAACQVYQGVAAERPSTDKAVKYTAGQVLMYKGSTISAVFHSCCGGQTDDAKDVWRSKGFPYLRGVRGRWCRRESPHYLWKSEVPGEKISRALRSSGRNIGERLKSVRIVSRTGAGRAYEVRVTGDKGGATLQANEFRLLVGARQLKSTLWSGISSSGGKWRFHGQGWGHGVGLCQWCAKITADQGYKYKEILSYFYRHAKVKEL